MIEDRAKRRSYLLLLAPAVVIYAGVILFPVLVSIGLSLTKWKMAVYHSFVWLENYAKIFRDPVFWTAFWNNVQIMISSVFAQIPLGFALAYLLFRKLVRGGRFFEVMIFLPITISSVVVALLWNRIFSPVGAYTALVRTLTGNPDYVMTISENPWFAMVPILFVLLWMHTSLYMVIFLANMQRLPSSLIEAAVIDGAGEGTILLKVVAPPLAGVLFTASIFAVSGSLKSFDLIYAMTNGGPVHYTYVMSIYMFRHTFTNADMGYGSAVSLIIVFFSVGFISFLRWVYAYFQRKYE